MIESHVEIQEEAHRRSGDFWRWGIGLVAALAATGLGALLTHLFTHLKWD